MSKDKIKNADQKVKAEPKTAKKPKKKKPAKKSTDSSKSKFPRHSILKAIRVPKAILEQNAGKACTDREAAGYVGVGFNGPFRVEISSAIKYGFLERPTIGNIQPTALAKKIIRPQSAGDEIEGYREAVLNAPDISDVYKHYRGENLPDDKFLSNTLAETYNISVESFLDFKAIFIESLQAAELLIKHGDKTRVVDITSASPSGVSQSERIQKLGKDVSVNADDYCFVMQPFSAPLGEYYDQIYKPAIEKAGLRAVRADADIFGTGKIIDQVWRGITSAKILVAELTDRNPNVFYELGLAHAMQKPVVLVSASEKDVPFDLHHIRVIYYDTNDPFWGNKLIDKVAENILSAMKHPEEAVFKTHPKDDN